MCGLTGLIFGKKKRSKEEYEFLMDIFTTAFLFSEERGHHASGITRMSIDGKYKLYKLPVSPSRMIDVSTYNDIIDHVDDDTTILMGHSRWKTVGSEFKNYNNQPILAGSILGTHNGTISNYNSLFQIYQFKRFAEVDSEILFRMADASLQDGIIHTGNLNNYLSKCRGSLSFVFVSKTDPGSVYLYHGDKPLFLYYNPALQVLFYSSSKKYIEDSLADSRGWVSITFPENKMYQTTYSDFTNIISENFFFIRNIPIKREETMQKLLFR